MKKSSILFLLTLITVFSFSTEAQETGKDIPITPEEKRIIVSMFTAKEINRKLYVLQLGKEVYGARTIASSEMERIRNSRLEEKGIIIICKETNSMIIYLRDGSIILASSGRAGTNQFLNLLGKEKTKILQKIMTKYVANADLLGAPDT